MNRLRPDEIIRILGSLLVIVGWFVVMNTSVSIGGFLTFVGDLLGIPWAMRAKAWDVVIMVIILHIVTIHKLALSLS